MLMKLRFFLLLVVVFFVVVVVIFVLFLFFVVVVVVACFFCSCIENRQMDRKAERGYRQIKGDVHEHRHRQPD